MLKSHVFGSWEPIPHTELPHSVLIQGEVLCLVQFDTP